MKIGIDVSQMCYKGTGVARYVRGLTEALLSFESDHEFVLFVGALRQRSFFQNLIHTNPWNKASWKLFPIPPKIAGLALNALPIKIESLIGKVDLYHSSDWAEVSSTCPRVTTVHDLVFMKYPETVDKLILDTQTNRLKKIVSSGTQIIADSVSTKNDLMEIYGLPDSFVDVVYPGLDKQYAVQSQSEIDRVKNKYHLPKDYILSLGTQEPRKNIPRLIEACKDLSIPLVLTGRHGWGDKYSSLTPGIISTGYVDEADLPALYSGATVFVYPSLYEGFGFPVLEAMACGTPVVTSKISSLPEVVGDAAVLVDPMDIAAITTGIDQALKTRDKLIGLGFAQAKKFTWEQTAEQVLEVYEKIIRRD